MADILFLKHDSSTLIRSSDPVCGSWKSQVSSPWAKQHSTYPVPTWRNHTGLDDCLRVLLSCFRKRMSAEQSHLFLPHSIC